MTSLWSTNYIFILLTTFQIYAGMSVFQHPPEHSCSSRPDMTCPKCNGIPECFDLSDELDCLNRTFKFIPIQKATKECMDKACLKVFPGPPPLPPFSLCDVKQSTTAMTNTPITTKTSTTIPTTQATTVPNTDRPPSTITTIPITTMSSSSSSRVITVPSSKIPHTTTTTQPTTEMSSSFITTTPRTRTTCKTTRIPATTKPPFRTTTRWWDITFERTTLRPTTAVPPWSSTPWTSTSSPALRRTFMAMWRSCASVYYTSTEILSCTVNCYFRPCIKRGFSNCYNNCVRYHDNRRRIVVPTTAASIFRAAPTQRSPTSRYVTNPNNWYGQNDSGRISALDMSYLLMLFEIYNK